MNTINAGAGCAYIKSVTHASSVAGLAAGARPLTCFTSSVVSPTSETAPMAPTDAPESKLWNVELSLELIWPSCSVMELMTDCAGGGATEAEEVAVEEEEKVVVVEG